MEGWLTVLLHCCSSEGNRGVHREIEVCIGKYQLLVFREHVSMLCWNSVTTYKYEHQKRENR